MPDLSGRVGYFDMRVSTKNMKMTLKKIVIVAGLAGSFLTGAQAAENTNNIDAGKAASASCAGCHGVDGNSAVGSFPKLAGQGVPYLVKQMQDIKSGARKVVEMTGLLDGLTDADINNMAAYFNSKIMSGGQAKEALIEKGEALYRIGNPAISMAACSACHGPAGEGVALAKFPSLAGQHADYIASQLRKFRSGERSNDGDGRIMRSVAARISDKEIEAVSSYIAGLHK